MYVLSDANNVSVSALIYHEDKTGQLDMDSIESSDIEWKAHLDDGFKQGYSGSTWWLRFDIKNPFRESQERVLSIDYPPLDRADVYILSGDSLISHYSIGDSFPFSNRPVISHVHAIPIHFEPDQTLSIYYRVRTDSSVEVPITLWQPEYFLDYEAKDNILNGFYYGALLVIAVYNLLIFSILRDRSYLYYVGFVMSVPLFSAVFNGDAFRYVWPNATVWNNIAIPMFLSTAMIFGSLFTRKFLCIKDISLFWYRTMTVKICIGGVAVLASLFMPYGYLMPILIPIVILHCMVDVILGIYAWHKNVESARYYCLGWFFLLFGIMIMALSAIELFPSNWISEYSVRVGSVAEAVLLSFALANKIGSEKKLRYEAQNTLLETTRRMNQELEYRVKERTDRLEVANARELEAQSTLLETTRRMNQELEERVQERTEKLEIANERLRELSDTDELTGLKNRRFLDKAAADEWIRSKRYKHSIGWLMVDIDYFKNVNDTYGHDQGDTCLKAVARKLMEGLRCPTDIVVRYGGEEFCVLMPETDDVGAAAVAERIRRLVENTDIIAGSGIVKATISLGVYAAIPSSDRTVEYMIKCADTALYKAKRNGRNRVEVYRENDDGNDDSNVTRLPTSG